MSKNNREDIQDKLDFVFLSLFSKKINVGIIGGGKAGLIKAKTFLNRGANLWVLSREFEDEFSDLKVYGVQLVKGEYYEDFIKDKHLVIIAVDDLELNVKIKKHCEMNYKIYFDCTDFNSGMGVIPAQRDTKNLSFSVHTKGGNPKASMLLLNKIEKELLVYDDFVEAINPIRKRAKSLEQKAQINSFINTEDFKYFYEKGYTKEVLLLFFKEAEVKYLLSID